MSKRFSPVIFSFSLLVMGIILNRSQLARANYPVIPNSEIDAPFCYMEMADGRRIDLRNLCVPKEEVSTCTSGEAGMVISNVRYDGNSLTGQVTNRTCKTVNLVKVNYQILDEQGNEIDNGYIDTQPSRIPQGKTASFGSAIAPGSRVNVTHVDWSNG
jgi:hypothetical protein